MADFYGDKGCGPTHHLGCECHEAKRNAEIERLRAENQRLREALGQIRSMVDEQAEDEGLWATPLHREVTIFEAYTQQELRKLHALIEDLAASRDEGEK